MKKIRLCIFIVIATFTILINAEKVLGQLRIVCIGNSITQGKNERRPDSSFEYSYRPWLWQKLLQNGFTVDMVGFHPYFFGEKEGQLNLHFDYQGMPFDRDCEAYYGITSSAFVNGSRSPGWTGTALPKFSDRINDPVKGYTPDIALMHIGTNDADSTAALVGKTKDNIREIVRILRAKNPDVVVLLAKLITGWKKINPEIDGLCAELYTQKSPVVSVDLTTGFINKPTSDGSMTYDYVHPNKKGQLYMMEKWYDAIVKNLTDKIPPAFNGKLIVKNIRSNEAVIEWPKANDNYGIHSYQIYVNGILTDSIKQNQERYIVRNLETNRKNNIQILAKDWAGNRSAPITGTIKTRKIR